uniref:3-keto-steroid reductase n=1 Tax=Arion vulgaris TaxID=1028688 RepID=A0A0B7A3C3_9EUPU
MEAATSLKALSSDANISVVILDTSSVQSVYLAAEDICKRYDHIDLLYLNAGMMTVKGVDWNYFWQGLFSRRVFFMFATGEGLLMQEDNVTEDGLQRVFESNVFGHYVLIKELEDRLGSISDNSEATSQLIWTSSSASLENNFDLEDFQHKNGKNPYSSSKFATDAVSIGLNNKMNKQNVFSHTICPGLVMTNLTYGICPAWVWTILLPVIWLLRIFVPSMTKTTSNGSEALFWLSHQDPRKLDPQTKYHSAVNMFGKVYVENCKMKIDPDKADQIVHKFDELDSELRNKYKTTTK